MTPPDIGRPHGLTPAMRADIHSRIGAIPGCGLLSLSAGGAGSGFGLSMTGWSPTLHRVDIDVSMEPPAGAGLEQALAMLETMLGLQRRRAAAGLALGTPFPLDHRMEMPMGPGDGMRIPEVRHLWIDRSAAATIIARHPRGDADDAVMASVTQPLSRLHETGTTGGWHQMGGNGIAFTDETGRPVAEPTVAVTRDVISNGEELVLTGMTVPDTAAALLVDGPLERLVDLGAHFAGRRIAGVKTFQTHVVVDLVPDLVRLDRVLGGGADDEGRAA